MTDALEARQEAHSIWDAAGDRFRSSETYRWLSRLHWFAGHRDPGLGNIHGSRYRSLAARTRPNWRWPTVTLPNCEWLPATSGDTALGPAALEVLDHQPDDTATTGSASRPGTTSAAPTPPPGTRKGTGRLTGGPQQARPALPRALSPVRWWSSPCPLLELLDIGLVLPTASSGIGGRSSLQAALVSARW
jgi:hypothetical protein